MSQVVPLPPISLDTAGSGGGEGRPGCSGERDWDAWQRNSRAWAAEAFRQNILGELAQRTPEFLGVHHVVQGEPHTIGALQLSIEPCPATGLGQAVLRIIPALPVSPTGETQDPVIIPLSASPPPGLASHNAQPSDSSRVRYAFGHRVRVVRISQRLINRSFPVSGEVKVSGPASPPTEPGAGVPGTPLPLAPPQLQQPIVEVDIAVDRPPRHGDESAARSSPSSEDSPVPHRPHIEVGMEQKLWISTMGGPSRSSMVLGPAGDELEICLHLSPLKAAANELGRCPSTNPLPEPEPEPELEPEPEPEPEPEVEAAPERERDRRDGDDSDGDEEDDDGQTARDKYAYQAPLGPPSSAGWLRVYYENSISDRAHFDAAVKIAEAAYAEGSKNLSAKSAAGGDSGNVGSGDTVGGNGVGIASSFEGFTPREHQQSTQWRQDLREQRQQQAAAAAAAVIAHAPTKKRTESAKPKRRHS